MVNIDHSKGERLAAAIGAANPLSALPVQLTETSVLEFDFDAEDMDLVSPVLELLDIKKQQQHEQLSTKQTPASLLSCELLAAIQPPLLGSRDVYFSIKFRQLLQDRVRHSKAIDRAYTNLIERVIAPHIYNQLNATDRLHLTKPTNTDRNRIFTIRYQHPPSLRIHPAHTTLFKRTHRDLEYGHQPAEINFWLPLTTTKPDDSPTMEIEENQSSDGLAFPYRPVRLDLGQIQRFHGTLLHHRVPPNSSNFTRVSLDFRVAPVLCFDLGWKLPGLKIQHTYREFDLIVDV
ncbi:hypothetical protein HK100_002135 [Physocladia obscura]|uniref:Uncharacterized protein n=1 Tax=Physocladia obscura TaxID=109957 RepID=A0AAD5XE19_9FUNG|nr:hypothetical protein HK100_002135 [Physocladia obscura]